MVVHKVTGIKIYKSIKLRKSETDTIRNDKATLEQRYMHTIKPEYGNGDKVLAALLGKSLAVTLLQLMLSSSAYWHSLLLYLLSSSAFEANRYY